MSTSNAKLKIRNRSVEIKWTSEYADHIMDNYINKNSSHGLTFSEISRLLRKSKFVQMKGNRYEAYGIANGKKYLVVIMLIPNFAVVKTCYRYG